MVVATEEERKTIVIYENAEIRQGSVVIRMNVRVDSDMSITGPSVSKVFIAEADDL